MRIVLVSFHDVRVCFTFNFTFDFCLFLNVYWLKIITPTCHDTHFSQGVGLTKLLKCTNTYSINCLLVHNNSRYHHRFVFSKRIQVDALKISRIICSTIISFRTRFLLCVCSLVQCWKTMHGCNLVNCLYSLSIYLVHDIIM